MVVAGPSSERQDHFTRCEGQSARIGFEPGEEPARRADGKRTCDAKRAGTQAAASLSGATGASTAAPIKLLRVMRVVGLQIALLPLQGRAPSLEPLQRFPAEWTTAMVDVEEKDRPLVFRDEEGEVVPAYSERVSAALAADNITTLRELVGGLHEADQGALLELLDHDERPKLIETLGEDFDFAALTEVDDNVREEILDELDPETVIEVLKTSNPMTRSIFSKISTRMEQPRFSKPCQRASASRCRNRSISRKLRWPPHAHRSHRGAAVLDGRAGAR